VLRPCYRTPHRQDVAQQQRTERLGQGLKGAAQEAQLAFMGEEGTVEEIR